MAEITGQDTSTFINYSHLSIGRRGAVVKGVEHISAIVFSQHLSGAGSSPAGSVGRDLNLQKLNY